MTPNYTEDNSTTNLASVSEWFQNLPSLHFDPLWKLCGIPRVNFILFCTFYFLFSTSPLSWDWEKCSWWAFFSDGRWNTVWKNSGIWLYLLQVVKWQFLNFRLPKFIRHCDRGMWDDWEVAVMRNWSPNSVPKIESSQMENCCQL